MSEIGVGDTVSLSIAGVVTDLGEYMTEIDGYGWVWSKGVVLVEKAKPPVYNNSTSEPQEGDWAVSPFGGWVIAMTKGLWTFKDGTPERNQPKGPMRLLVRNGREFTGDAA